MLKELAINFWRKNINDKTEYTNIDAFCRTLENKFDTPAQKHQIEAIAGPLRQIDIINKCTRSHIAALGVFYDEFTRLTQQSQYIKCAAAFQTQTLIKIVQTCNWSRSAKEDILSDPITYVQLYVTLSESLDIWESEVARSGKNVYDADDHRLSYISEPSFVACREQFYKPLAVYNRR